MAIEWILHDGKAPPVLSQHQKIYIHLNGCEKGDTRAYFVEDFCWVWKDGEATYGDVYAYALANSAPAKGETSKVVSNGGSSEYYKITVRCDDGEFQCETDDIIYALVGGDFSLGNIIKACRRMYEASQGRGKDGTSIQYDANKVKYSADDFAKRFGDA